MSLLHGLLLGLLQGLTEFLPVSSSGHLALAQALMPRFEQPGVVFDVVLHLGTSAAVVWAERGEIVRWLTTTAGWRLLGLLVCGTAVTGAVGLVCRTPATAAFRAPAAVGVALAITGAVVLASRWLSGGAAGESRTGWREAAVMGAAQGLAVFPGLSRSGLTIVAGLGSGLHRAWVARFSFLLSVPAVVAVSVVELVSHSEQLGAVGRAFWGPALLGAAAAAVSGYVALRIVVRTVSSRHFHRFGFYCLPLGLVVIALYLGGLL